MVHTNIQEQFGDDLLDITLCPVEMLMNRIEDILPFLQKACDRSWSNLNVDEIIEDVRVGRTQLWVIYWTDTLDVMSVITTEIVKYSNGKLTCSVVTLSGEGFGQYQHKIAVIEDWAREQGCVAVEVSARRGFKKYLEKLDYFELYVGMKKDLKQNIH